MPRIGSLILTMPFLVILADFTGILGGAAVGVLMLDIPWAEYWKYSHDALNMTNFLVGIFTGSFMALLLPGAVVITALTAGATRTASVSRQRGRWFRQLYG